MHSRLIRERTVAAQASLTQSVKALAESGAISPEISKSVDGALALRKKNPAVSSLYLLESVATILAEFATQAKGNSTPSKKAKGK